MMFGDPQRFAIELELYQKSAGIWMNGHACYWISGERVGNYDLIDSLRDVLFRWERMSYDRDRVNNELWQLDTQELLRTLTCGLYNFECADQEMYDERAIEGQWARHNINPGTVEFDAWRIYLVESETEARCVFIHDDDPPRNGREQRLQAGDFDRVLRGAIAFLLQIYIEEGGEPA